MPVSVAAEVVAGGAFGAGVVRKADAGVGRVLHDGGSAGMVVAGFGCCWAKRCWSAMKSMRAMAVFLPLVAPQTLGHIRSALEPTFVADAHDLTGVPIEDYDLILADPPYSYEDADHYGTALVSRNEVVEVLSHRMQLGAHLAWLDQAQPMYSKARLKPEAAIGIVRSTMHRYRCLLIWRRVSAVPG